MHFAVTKYEPLVFSIFCYAYFPVVFCLYPETSRRTLEDMDFIFESNPHVLVAGKPDLTSRKRPQAFIDAEMRRIEAGEQKGDMPEVLDDVKGTVVREERAV
jgi:hypothetical protein